MIRDRRAKIVAAVGPAGASPFMFMKDVDNFRLNFSNGEHANYAAVIAAICAL